jgi:hypothetical protein
MFPVVPLVAWVSLSDMLPPVGSDVPVPVPLLLSVFVFVFVFVFVLFELAVVESVPVWVADPLVGSPPSSPHAASVSARNPSENNGVSDRLFMI